MKVDPRKICAGVLNRGISFVSCPRGMACRAKIPRPPWFCYSCQAGQAGDIITSFFSVRPVINSLYCLYTMQALLCNPPGRQAGMHGIANFVTDSLEVYCNA